MESVHWVDRPDLRRPLFVIAFEGWNDAGDAATQALDYLAQEWRARRCATIDPEEFYDFTVTRPDGPTSRGRRPPDRVAARRGAGRPRCLAAPTTCSCCAASSPSCDGGRFARRWCRSCETLGAELVVVLGALLADVPHTRPVRVTGHDHRPGPQPAGRASPPRPTRARPGSSACSSTPCARPTLPAASLWAAVPHYVHQVPSPKAALALVERSAAAARRPGRPAGPAEAADEYERQVSERVADDEDAAAYVAQLEDAEDLESAGDPSEPGPDGSQGQARVAAAGQRRRTGRRGGALPSRPPRQG